MTSEDAIAVDNSALHKNRHTAMPSFKHSRLDA
jgi:hypothetical protein